MLPSTFLWFDFANCRHHFNCFHNSSLQKIPHNFHHCHNFHVFHQIHRCHKLLPSVSIFVPPQLYFAIPCIISIDSTFLLPLIWFCKSGQCYVPRSSCSRPAPPRIIRILPPPPAQAWLEEVQIQRKRRIAMIHIETTLKAQFWGALPAVLSKCCPFTPISIHDPKYWSQSLILTLGANPC